MENWGLLTYKEKSLLVDNNVDDAAQRYRIAVIVAHEVVGVGERRWGGGEEHGGGGGDRDTGAFGGRCAKHGQDVWI